MLSNTYLSLVVKHNLLRNRSPLNQINPIEILTFCSAEEAEFEQYAPDTVDIHVASTMFKESLRKGELDGCDGFTLSDKTLALMLNEVSAEVESLEKMILLLRKQLISQNITPIV